MAENETQDTCSEEKKDEVLDNLKTVINGLTDLIYSVIKNRTSKESTDDFDNTRTNSSKGLDD
jgi:hypothetical protein